jgi:hypothetical protein
MSSLLPGQILPLPAIAAPLSRHVIPAADPNNGGSAGKLTQTQLQQTPNTTVAQVTAAADVTLIVGTSNPVRRYDFAAGGGTYTYNIDLSTAGAANGDTFELYINKAASTNPTIVVRNGVAGATLVSLNNGSAQNYYSKFIFDGTNWLKMAFVLNTL